jgi:hypothetical protein
MTNRLRGFGRQQPIIVPTVAAPVPAVPIRRAIPPRVKPSRRPPPPPLSAEMLKLLEDGRAALLDASRRKLVDQVEEASSPPTLRPPSPPKAPKSRSASGPTSSKPRK